MAEKPVYKAELQAKPVYEPEPLPGEKPPTNFGAHPHSVYQRARIESMRGQAEDDVAMRKLKDVSSDLAKRTLPSGTEAKEDTLPGFKGKQFIPSLARPRKFTYPPLETTGGPAKGANWSEMSAEERSKAIVNQGTRQTVPNPAAAPGDPKARISLAAFPSIKTLQLSDSDVQVKESTGLDVPAPKAKKMGLRAAIKRAAEQVGARHYETHGSWHPEEGPDIKRDHGSALGYFKQTFTANGSNEEVEDHIVSNYSHLLPDEYKRTPEQRTRTAPRDPSPSSDFVKKFAANPLSAFRD